MDAATGTASWQIASTDEMYFVCFCRASDCGQNAEMERLSTESTFGSV